MSYPQDSETQAIDGVRRIAGNMESGVSADDSSISHKDIRIMYTKTNQTLTTNPGVVLDKAIEAVHTNRTPKTVRTLAEFPPKPTTPCIEWHGKRLPSGYGYFSRSGKLVYAHRDAWEKAHGPIPPKAMVCHACDNRACRNVEHLWLGTQADNMGDCKAKGRPRGRPYRFSDDEMRRMAATPGTVQAVGEQYGVGKDSISRWRRRFGIPAAYALIGLYLGLLLALTGCESYHPDPLRNVVDLVRGAGALGPHVLP